MGRHGGGKGSGGGNGAGSGKGRGSWDAAAGQPPGTWHTPGSGGWHTNNDYDNRGWGQPPARGWSQHPQTAGWDSRAAAWSHRPGPYDHGAKAGGKGPRRGADHEGPGQRYGRREAGGGQGVLQGLQQVTAAARVALDAAKELRSLGGPAPSHAPGQGSETTAEGASRGWLSAARRWLLGDGPAFPHEQEGGPPAQAAPTPPRAPAGAAADPDYAVLLGKLLGADAPERREPEAQSQEVARLSAALARQQQLLALLVDRVATPGPNPAQRAPAAPPPAPPALQARATDAYLTDKALLEELLVLREACRLPEPAAGHGKEETGEDAAGSLPLQAPAVSTSKPLTRPPPALTAFDPEGDVTPSGADAFWAWLDVTPRAPWTAPAQYAVWAAKVVYKCTTAELQGWAAKLDPADRQDAPPGHLSKRDLLDGIARSCAAAARVRAASGPSGNPTPGHRPTVLESLRLRVQAAEGRGAATDS